MIKLLKRGNRSSGLSALGNVAIAIIKGIAALISGSGAMFATMITPSQIRSTRGWFSSEVL